MYPMYMYYETVDDQSSFRQNAYMYSTAVNYSITTCTQVSLIAGLENGLERLNGLWNTTGAPFHPVF